MMFPYYEDSKTMSVLSVRTLRKEITLASSISVLHLVIDSLIHQWKGLHEYYSMEFQKFEFFSIKLEIEF